MGPFKILALAFAATVSAQGHPQVASTSTGTPQFLPPSGTNLLPPIVVSSSVVNPRIPSASTSVTVIVHTSVTSGTPWPTDGLTVQTSFQSASTTLITQTLTLVNGTVPVSNGTPIETPSLSGSTPLPTTVITTTASNAASKPVATTTTSAAASSKTANAGLQNEAGSAGKIGGVGVALAMLIGVLGA
ncbi:hypothetical protein CC86DRAFT_470990 [Ophiobolus disseminans]|uniref:GPI anchored protein n=1 Tax=Ophiobolus disseminans TaxID=1469910 RepID=A0A6A6ZJU6_9PLEO|nr:hypothetical protein CC86DRAFT_470990 [Ophiobolus disseminans]